MKNYILIGPPGSGKSTQAEYLCQKYGLAHIDIGAELRAAAEEDTPFARDINDIIHNKKELVPDTIVYGVLSQALLRLPREVGIVLDGAPRVMTQVDEVLHVLQASGRTVDKAIFIKLTEAESVDRISRRYKCFACGHRFILGKDIETPTTRCSRCGGKIGQRKDDTKEGVRKRYHIFHDETLPVVDEFRKKGMLVEVDGDQGMEAMSREIDEKLNPHGE